MDTYKALVKELTNKFPGTTVQFKNNYATLRRKDGYIVRGVSTTGKNKVEAVARLCQLLKGK